MGRVRPFQDLPARPNDNPDGRGGPPQRLQLIHTAAKESQENPQLTKLGQTVLYGFYIWLPHPPIPHSSCLLLKAAGEQQWDTERGECYRLRRGRAPAWVLARPGGAACARQRARLFVFNILTPWAMICFAPPCVHLMGDRPEKCSSRRMHLCHEPMFSSQVGT